jgi:serine/threonine protein kinase
MNNLVGRTLGQYKIIEHLAMGGMADIYKAEDTHVVDRVVIIKIIRKNDRYAEDFLKRFEREIKVLARLSHPHIVKIINAGKYNGLPYLVMEYFSGGTLEEKLGKPIPWQESVRFLLPVAQALDYIHKQNILHRDIKPSNILFTESGAPMLSDFGIVKILDREIPGQSTTIDALIGTPGYMAPEQVRCETVDQRTDIYVLGIVFYEMVTGQRLYPKDSPLVASIKAVIEPSVPLPTEFIPDLPKEVEQVILKALARKPEDRYQSMDVLVQAFEHLISAQEQPNREELPPSISSSEPLPVQETPLSISAEPLSDQESSSPVPLPEEHVEVKPPTVPIDNNTVTPIRKKRLQIIFGLVGCIIILFLILYSVVNNLTWSVLPTKTATATATYTPSLTPTSVPTNIIFQDDFSNPESGWETLSRYDSFTKYNVNDKNFQIYVKNNMEIWSHNTKFISPGNVRIEVEATMSGDSTNNYFGIICRYQNDDNFYMAVITSAGFRGIGLREQGNFTWLKEPLPSNPVKLGAVTNKIRFDCINNELDLYVNGQLAGYVNNETFPSDGAIGLIAAKYNGEVTNILFRNLKVFLP